MKRLLSNVVPRYRRRRTEVWIITGVLLLIVLLSLGASSSLQNLRVFIDIANKSQHDARVALGLQALLSDMVEAQSAQHATLVTSDVNHLARAQVAMIGIRRAFEELLRLSSGDPRLHSEFLSLQKVVHQRLGPLQDAIDYHRIGQASHALSVLASPDAASVADKDTLQPLNARYKVAFGATAGELKNAASNTAKSFFWTCVLAAAAIVLMALFAYREARSSRALSSRLRHESWRDSSTGLPNRTYLKEWLSLCIAHAERNREKFCILYIRVDGLTLVNETFGRKERHRVLVEVAQQIISMTRTSDFVARLAADQFAIVMPGITQAEQIEAAAKRLTAISIERDPIAINVTVACSVFPEDGKTVDDLVQVTRRENWREHARKPSDFAAAHELAH